MIVPLGNLMATEKYMVLLTEDEDGFITAECPSLPGCVSQGKTRDEAIRNISEAISLWLETNESRGYAIRPAEITEVSISSHG